MAFSWSESITTSVTYIKVIHYSELQTNIDWLNDNRGCAANNSVDNTSDDGTVDTGDDVTINATADSGYDSSQDSPDYSSAANTVETGEDTTYFTTDDANNDGTKDDIVNNPN
jgi:hypothetical protein